MAGIEFLALFSFAFGLFFSIRTLIYVFENKAVFEITEKARLFATERLNHLKKKVEKVNRQLENLDRKIGAKDHETIESMKLMLWEQSKRIDSLTELLQKSYLPYSELQDGESKFKSINQEVEKIGAWIRETLRSSRELKS